jgi:hypothetical protein
LGFDKEHVLYFLFVHPGAFWAAFPEDLLLKYFSISTILKQLLCSFIAIKTRTTLEKAQLLQGEAEVQVMRASPEFAENRGRVRVEQGRARVGRVALGSGKVG